MGFWMCDDARLQLPRERGGGLGLNRSSLVFVALLALFAFGGCGWYNDYKLTQKVKKALEMDARVSPFLFNNKVTWNVTNGVVKLRGTVCENWEKDRFTETAKSVEGVKDVDNGIKVDICQGSNPLFLNPFG